MEFWQYPDEYKMALKMGKRDPKEDAGTFFHRALWQRQIEAAAALQKMNRRKHDYILSNLRQTLAEDHWFKAGRPYVKVYPKMAELLSRIRINVPMSILKLPYPAFEIRLSAEEKSWLRETPTSEPVQSIFVFQTIEYMISDADMFRMMATRKLPDIDKLPAIKTRVKSEIDEISIFFLTGFDMETATDKFVEFHYDPDVTIEDALQSTMDNGMMLAPSLEMANRVYMPGMEFMKRITSLVLATCLLISGDDENVLPDLPRALIDRYERSKGLNGDDLDRENAVIMDKARKSGHYGLNLGRRYELELPRPIYDRSDSESSGDDSGGYELRHTHFRSPHPRMQPFGPRGNPQYKIRWIPMTQVRPDLPPNPNPRNYRITDRGL